MCRNDETLRPPYWLPASAELAKGTGGLLATTPVDSVVDPARAIRNSVPATVTAWDEGSATIQVNAPADGHVYIDRTWWPSWQVSVDDAPVKPERTRGRQLVAVSAGAQTIAQRFVPWDAGLGALMSIGSLLLIGVWSRRRRLHGQPALDTPLA